MRYPTSSFEEDKNINYKLATRSLVADAMLHIHAVVAWYEKGDYYFLIQDDSQPRTAEEIAEKIAEMNIPNLTFLFTAIDNLALAFYSSGYPPAPPIIDPIYFGT